MGRRTPYSSSPLQDSSYEKCVFLVQYRVECTILYSYDCTSSTRIREVYFYRYL